MTVFTKPALDVFAPYDAAGNERQIVPQEVQVWGTEVERIVDAFVAGGGTVTQFKVQLDGNLNYPTNTMAWVVADPTTANNGIYRKIGNSGTGYWLRVADLPYSFVRLTDTGAGTANAIQLTSAIPTSPSVLRVANVFEANTGNVTISENGGAPKPLLTNSGNQITAGGLTAGSMIVYVDDGSNFRLLSDEASAAIVAAAEAARDLAKQYRDEAQAAAASAAGIPSAATIAELAAADIIRGTVSLTEYRREGIFDARLISSLNSMQQAEMAADTLNGIYVPSSVDPLYVWIRRGSETINVRWFGAIGNSNGTPAHGNDDTAAFLVARNIATMRRGGEIVVPTMGSLYYRLTSTILFDSNNLGEGDGITFRASGPASTRIYPDHTGIGFKFGQTRFVSSLQFWGFDIRNNADGGNLLEFDGGAAFSVFEHLYLYQKNINRRCIYGLLDGDGTDGTKKQVVECTIRHSTLDCTNLHATNLAYIASNTGARANCVRWESVRVHNKLSPAAGYAIVMACLHSTVSFTGNKFIDIVGEQNRGGLIQLLGNDNALIELAGVHDLGNDPEDSEVTASMVYLADGPNGAPSGQITVMNYRRTAGKMASGAYDIAAHGVKNLVLINNDAQENALTPMKVYIGDGTTATVIGTSGVVKHANGVVNKIREALAASLAYDPPEIAAGATHSFTIPLVGLAPGDRAEAQSGGTLSGCMKSVEAVTDGIKVTLFNPTAAPVNIGSATWRGYGEKRSEYGL